MIAAFCSLHYGAPYLAASIRSVIDAVDLFCVVYTDVPSHGYTTTMRPPDTRDELYAIALAAAGSKLVWRDGRFPNESAHRAAIFELVPAADVVLIVDSDEVWMPDQLDTLLNAACTQGYRNYLAYGVHFWRSMHKAVTYDRAAPVRAIKPSGAGDHAVDAWFAHLGYAQPSPYIKYKISCWGHKDELRQGWFDDIWLANNPHDCHPTNERGFWIATDVDPLQYMPAWMEQHPYYGLEVIE